MPSHAAATLPPAQILAQTLKARLPGFAAVQWMAQTQSTNASLLALAKDLGQPVSWPRLLGAHHQTQGKGRQGRVWHDLAGQALMFSVGFAISRDHSPTQLAGLGPALGMSSVKALQPFLVEPTRLQVKWPNDLMFDHGKCAGILIELATTANAMFVIIGIGINLSGHHSLENTLNREIADLGPHLQPNVLVDELVAMLTGAWQNTLTGIMRDGFIAFRDDYAQVDYLANQTVAIIDQGHIMATGIACGPGLDGGLNVKTSAGLQTFRAGDVSVRLNTRMLSE